MINSLLIPKYQLSLIHLILQTVLT